MIAPRLDDAYAARLARLCPDGLTIFTLEGDTIRGVLSSATTMVASMRAAHGLGLLETDVLGRAYVAASLLSATIKGDDRIVVRVEGDGPAQGYSVECNALGDVRGRLFNPAFEPGAPPEALDAGPLVGSGYLTVTRFMGGATEPVSGKVALASGRIAEDLTRYFLESEQTRSSFTIGLHFSPDGAVAGAGGLFLQALPGASDEALDRVERLVYGIPPIGAAYATGASRMDICLRAFPFFDYNHLDDKPTRFYCSCSKERLGAYIGALPADELDEMVESGPFPLEVTCHNCGSTYGFSQAELVLMVNARRGI